MLEVSIFFKKKTAGKELHMTQKKSTPCFFTQGILST